MASFSMHLQFSYHRTPSCGEVPQLGLPTSLPFRKSNTKRTIGIIVGAICVGVSVTVIALFFYVKNREKQPGPPTMISFDGQHRAYSFYDLKAVTGNFSEENLIRRGSFGAVYRGVMRDGGLAAIKVLDMDQNDVVKSFMVECEAFRYIRHRNLVKILSACLGLDFKALVFQYMENRNLESWIHGNR
ncbi:probable LRR receptor-like serine/threonine-protein kinase At3g47570 [Benincasa hispida]|uniref:probable LRR receptor-like serine/threonine-protein kinase At3g47570 n=1 Tax=Benincasa hispida TaxID=102211 RepID=UPI0018FF3008|nr:probable LRR receptor-like serine/threonine-protein kinase At3g47570 [Benincasa hispida]